MEQLVDGDVILNNGGWQWSASTGADSQPWFRIFNPVTQSQKFDPKGDYIKKYLPELLNVPEKYIHEPWKMSVEDQKKYKVIIGKDYPFPVVDHKEQRLRALELYNI
jgi:deoxyribodipyrimidine photo-lyase